MSIPPKSPTYSLALTAQEQVFNNGSTLECILSFLSAKQLSQIASVNKPFQKIATRDELWKKFTPQNTTKNHYQNFLTIFKQVTANFTKTNFIKSKSFIETEPVIKMLYLAMDSESKNKDLILNAIQTKGFSPNIAIAKQAAHRYPKKVLSIIEKYPLSQEDKSNIIEIAQSLINNLRW